MDTNAGLESLNCPACGQINEAVRDFCWACHAPLKRAPPSLPAAVPEGKVDVSETSSWGTRLAVLVPLIYVFYRFLTVDGYFSPLDYINLAFHEAGHIVFMFFGEFIKTLGGTLMQLALPAACAAHFWARGAALGFDLTLWWVGENLLNVSVYIGDSLRQELPLVGGGVHDWTWLLERMGYLPKCEAVAKTVFVVGSILIVYSLLRIIAPSLNLPPYVGKRSA